MGWADIFGGQRTQNFSLRGVLSFRYGDVGVVLPVNLQAVGGHWGCVLGAGAAVLKLG